MYSLSISFGPTGLVWAFLFKEKEKAKAAELKAKGKMSDFPYFSVEDDFGQSGNFTHESVHGALLEDLDQIEEARIQRSLADERCKAKFMARAKSDPTIRQAMGQGPGIVSPFPR